jgi:hypothetical protein
MSTVTRLYPDRRPEPAQAALAPHAAADLDRAELFLLSLEAEVGDANPARMAYLLGLAEGHLANVVEHLRAVTQ